MLGFGPAWTDAKQAQYHAANSPQVYIHLLIDASLSMQSHRRELVTALDRYESWLKRFVSPFSMMQRWLFAGKVYDASPMVYIKELPQLTLQQYNPMDLLQQKIPFHTLYEGTHLHEALYACLMEKAEPVQHMLILFTDGQDTGSDEAIKRVCPDVMEHAMQDNGWLCCFLGTDMAAINVGLQLGFARGNCLYFAEDKFPEAFQRLQEATKKFLNSAPAGRKLLTQGGIF